MVYTSVCVVCTIVHGICTSVYVVYKCTCCKAVFMLYTNVHVVHKCSYCTYSSIKVDVKSDQKQIDFPCYMFQGL